MRFKGAIFDLDGTLLDSMGVWGQIDIDFLARRGLEVPRDYIKAITSMSFAQAAVYTVGRFRLPETPEAVMAEWNGMAAAAYRDTVALKPGAREFLQSARRAGVRLAVATASNEGLYIPCLRRCGIYPLFESFTTLSEVPRGKGFPDIYWRAAEKLGLSPADCAVFEDILPGIRSAKAGGFYTVGVWDASARGEQEEIIATADCYIRSFGELTCHPDWMA